MDFMVLPFTSIVRKDGRVEKKSRSFSSVLSPSLQLVVEAFTFEVPPSSTPRNGAVELQEKDMSFLEWYVALLSQASRD